MDVNEELPEVTEQPEESAEHPERVAPILSRFLFVDVAAQRAKQLRRGALPRLPNLRPDALTSPSPDAPLKLERVAMAEVGAGLIFYELPKAKDADPEEAG